MVLEEITGSRAASAHGREGSESGAAPFAMEGNPPAAAAAVARVAAVTNWRRLELESAGGSGIGRLLQSELREFVSNGRRLDRDTVLLCLLLSLKPWRTEEMAEETKPPVVLASGSPAPHFSLPGGAGNSVFLGD